MIDLTRGEGWEVLCPFLEKEIPRESFPHRNKSSFLTMIKIWGKRNKQNIKRRIKKIL